MDSKLLIVIAVSEAVSLALLVWLWARSSLSVIKKIIFSVICLIPVVGPFFYLFCVSEVPPQKELLKNRGGFGAYTQTWLSVRGIGQGMTDKMKEDEAVNNISIRTAKVDDAAQIAEVVNAAYRPGPGQEGWTHESALVAGSRVTLEQVVEALAGSMVLVAFSESGVVGCVQIQAEEREAHIGMLAVLPSIQAAGLGKMLLAAAERYAVDSLQASLFVLHVVAERRELIDFYLRRGYRETGECEPYPVEAGVGNPLDADISLSILQKIPEF